MSATFNKFLFLAIAIFCIVLSHELKVCSAFPDPQPGKIDGPGAFLGAKIDCKEKCHIRCSVASRYRACVRACNTCCQRCNCVPPGTAGNADVCPCWANMTTKGGRKKCP